MKIGELSKITGLASSKIRFYEKIGLLKSVNREVNGYRTYSKDAITILELITTAQQAGFTLDELRALLPPDLEDWDHHTLLESLKSKLHDIEELERKLASSKAQLKKVLSEIEAKPIDMDCATNAKRVLNKFGLGE